MHFRVEKQKQNINRTRNRPNDKFSSQSFRLKHSNKNKYEHLRNMDLILWNVIYNTSEIRMCPIYFCHERKM